MSVRHHNIDYALICGRYCRSAFSVLRFFFFFFLFFFNDPATTEIYTLSLHDALPISNLPLPAVPEVLEEVAEEAVADEDAAAVAVAEETVEADTAAATE